MNILPIHIYGDPVLRKKAAPIGEITEEVREFVDDMAATMFDAPGIGLAAPQVGKSVRLFIFDPNLGESEGDPQEFVAFIDPVIRKKSDDRVLIEEGCLSLPDIRADVERPRTITIDFTDLNGERHTAEVGGMLARVIQHEYDHLEGILFVDRINPVRRSLLGKQLKQLARSQKKNRVVA